MFSGTSTDDVNDWLVHYERVSRHNLWDNTIKLANVVFFLHETALRWFDNHQEEIISWDTFRTALGNVFGNAERKKQHVHERLSQQFQAANETSTAYIEDILHLCRRVNPHMSEENRLRHLFKGIPHDLFSGIASRPPDTAAYSIAECKHYEDLRSRRIFHGSFEQLPEVMSSPPRANPSASVRDVIRSEVQGFMPRLSTLLPNSGIQQIVQEELRTVLYPPP